MSLQPPMHIFRINKAYSGRQGAIRIGGLLLDLGHMTSFDPSALDRMVSESERSIRRLREATSALEAISGSGEAADGLVKAAVDHAGRLLEVSLDPRAMRQDSQTLAELITQAVRAAQDDSTRRCQELLTSVLDADTPAPFDLEALRDRLETALEAFSRSLDGHSDDRKGSRQA